MEVAGDGAVHRLRDGGDEGYDVVVGLGLYLVDALDGEVRLFGELLDLFGWDLAEPSTPAADGSSTSSQSPVLGLFCPDGPDLRKGVALRSRPAFQLCRLRVGECEYLRGQHCGVGGVYGYRRDRHARGHLDGGERGVEAAQGAGGDGDADDRQVGPPLRLRRVSCHACGADEDLDAAFGRGGDVFGDGFGVAVGGADLELVDIEVFEAVGALLHDRQVGFAADKDTDARAQRSSNSMASMAMSVRYCMPSKWICSTAA